MIVRARVTTVLVAMICFSGAIVRAQTTARALNPRVEAAMKVLADSAATPRALQSTLKELGYTGLHGDAWKTVVPLLKHSDQATRLAALELLARHSGFAEVAVNVTPAVVEMANAEKDPAAQRQAMGAVARFKSALRQHEEDQIRRLPLEERIKAWGERATDTAREREVRTGAMVEIARLENGRAAGVPYLVRALNDKDASIRRQAIHCLGMLSADAGTEGAKALREVLSDPDPAIRQQATMALQKVGAAAAAAGAAGGAGGAVDPAAFAALEAPDAETRLFALGGIDPLWKADPAAAERAVLNVARNDKDQKVRGRAIYTLGVYDVQWDFILASLGDKDPAVQAAARATLEEFVGRRKRGQLTPMLAKALELDNPIAQLNAAKQMMQYVGDIPPKDLDAPTRAAYAKACGIVLRHARTTSDEEIDQLEDRAGPWATYAPEALGELARDPDPKVRLRAVRLADNSVSALQHVATLLGDQEVEVRLRAADKLSNSEAGFAFLFAAMSDPRPAARVLAADTIRRLDIKPTATAAQLRPLAEAAIRMLDDRDPNARIMAGDLLGRFGAVEDLPHLLKLAADPDATVRGMACSALSPYAPYDAAALNALLKLMSDPEPRVRDYAVSWIGEKWRAIGTQLQVDQVVAALTARLDDPPVALAAAGKLAKLGPDARPAREKLQRMLASAKAAHEQYSLKRAIAAIGADDPATAALEQLRDALPAGEDGVRVLMQHAQPGVPARALAPLAAELADGGNPRRALDAIGLMIRVIGTEGGVRYRAVPPAAEIAQHLAAPDAATRKKAVDALAALGDAARPRTELLFRDAVKEEDAAVQSAAIAVLRRLWLDPYVPAAASSQLTPPTH